MKVQNNQISSILQKKRDKKELSSAEIKWWVDEYTQGSISDYQMAAFLMAVYLNGFTTDETAALTDAMLYSGRVLDPLGPLAVDKHSTGGVGDKTSFILAPLAAANGVKVPMIAGRGLGHTGGTIDKIESITGFNTAPSLDEFYQQVKSKNLALMGATSEIAPADKKIYALRDVTQTVESIPLITASIMSKKLAEGTGGIVMDVKTGQGAFMTSLQKSQELAYSLRQTAKRFNKNIITIISDMDTPLGYAIGNSLEIIECIEILKGRGPKDLRNLSIELAGAMIYLAKQASTHDEGKKMAEKSLEDGSGLLYFRQLLKNQGGDESFVDDYTKFPTAPCKFDIHAPEAGIIHSMNCRQLGHFCVMLGGGRKSKEDTIDLSVGLTLHKKTMDEIKKGDPIVSIYHQKGQEKAVKQIKEQIISDLVIKKSRPHKTKLIKEIKTQWIR